MAGPLTGIRIVEIAGIGPGPFAAMMLADHGAEVIRIDRPDAPSDPQDPLLRSRRTIALDLKNTSGAARVRELCADADGLIEGFRPGVMERLGLGPDVLLQDNPKLVYGRITGWGQYGSYAQMAGHDINYVALSGVLAACGRPDTPPLPPLNLVGDFGGGGMMLAFGMVSALLAVRAGAPGQVIDCAMTDGSALLSTMIWGFRAEGSWSDRRGTNLLDGGAPFYDSYETADGRYVALGPIEPKFYREMCALVGIADDPIFQAQYEQSAWPEQKRRLADVIRTRTRTQWCAILEGSDACFAPVLDMSECADHPHNAERGTFVKMAGVMQPAPAPRYSATPCPFPRPPLAESPDADWTGGSKVTKSSTEARGVL